MKLKKEKKASQCVLGVLQCNDSCFLCAYNSYFPPLTFVKFLLCISLSLCLSVSFLINFLSCSTFLLFHCFNPSIRLPSFLSPYFSLSLSFFLSPFLSILLVFFLSFSNLLYFIHLFPFNFHYVLNGGASRRTTQHCCSHFCLSVCLSLYLYFLAHANGQICTFSPSLSFLLHVFLSKTRLVKNSFKIAVCCMLFFFCYSTISSFTTFFELLNVGGYHPAI